MDDFKDPLEKPASCVLSCFQLECQNCKNCLIVHVDTKADFKESIKCRKCDMTITVTNANFECPTVYVYVFGKMATNIAANTSYPVHQHAGNNTENGQSQPGLRDGAGHVIDATALASCDACENVFMVPLGAYCRPCRQKLCAQCSRVHHDLTASKEHETETCWPKSRNLDGEQLEALLKTYGTSSDVATWFGDKTGLQVCLRASEPDGLQVLAPSEDLLDIAFQDLEGLDKIPDEEGVAVCVERGMVHWLFTGYLAKVVRTLFSNDISAAIRSSPGVTMSYADDLDEHKTASDVQHSDTGMQEQKENYFVLKISCGFDMFPAISKLVKEIGKRLKSLHTAEVERSHLEEFRVKIYAMVKANDPRVVCTEKKSGNVVTLVIHGVDQTKVQETKKEFLGLFCKECSVCHVESSRPLYLDCKHVLCHDCVTKVTRTKDDVACSLCPDGQGRVTPVRSLQVQCLEMIEEIIISGRQKKPATGQDPQPPMRPERKRISHGKQQFSTKIPKYLLQKWSRLSGGLTRLRSLVQNNFGFKVGGSDDNLMIYGETHELLDLAIHSIERLNEKPTENGVTCTLLDKMVVWRFRGDYSRIIYFLFNRELRYLVDASESIEMKCYTDFRPPVLDIKCPCAQYTEVKYKIDELVNSIAFLHEDEYIQPKTFYYNIKVREFLESKRNNENVFCDLRERNNRNVIVIKTRRKEYINITKDEIANW